MTPVRPTLLCALATVLAGCGGGTGARELGLTRNVPPIVHRACRQAARQTSIPVVCPRLVPQSLYVTAAGLWGAEVFSPRLWLLTFNNGDNGPGYVHWIVGSGGLGDVRYYVLGDENHAVRGLPKLWAMKTRGGRTLIDYRFPPYPAGGATGGHAAAFVPCGARFVFASLHGYEHMRVAEQMALDLARQARCPPEPPSPPARFRTMPAPASLASACDQIERAVARSRARWPVVCPPLVPWSPDPHVYVGGLLSTRDFRPGYEIIGRSPLNGSNSPYNGHWTFASGDPKAVHASLEVRDAIGRPQLRWTRRAARIAGQRVWIYRVDPSGMSELSGHVAIEWRWHGQGYQVSVHRWAGDRQGLVQARQMAEAVIGYLRHATVPVPQGGSRLGGQ